MNISLKKILAKRNTSSSANSGFLAGIAAGTVIAIFTLISVIISKEIMLEELSSSIEKLGVAIPYGADTLYLLGLIMTPLISIFISSIVGMVFGIYYNKIKNKNSVKVYLFGIVFGTFFGLITKLPADKTTIIIVNVIAWLLFSIVFLRLYKNRKNGNE